MSMAAVAARAAARWAARGAEGGAVETLAAASMEAVEPAGGMEG